MNEQKIPGILSRRIVIIDSLRGFSLFGILISHLSICFEAFDGSSLNAPQPSIINVIVSILNAVFFSGKFFAIFSFLFGLSFFIQMDNAAQKGINFQWRFLWRIVILFGVGYIHGLLFSGDILIIYAILGVFLVFLFRAKSKLLVFFIIVLLAGVPRFITYGFQKSQSGVNTKIENGNFEKHLNEMSQLYRTGSFMDVVKFNAVDGLKVKAEYQLGIEGRGYQTLALFFLGLLIGRRRYFENIEENMPLTRKVFKRSIWFTLGFLVLCGGLFAFSKGDMEKLSAQFAMTFYNLFNLSFALLIATAFIILYQRSKNQKFLINLAPYGKMGLTNYLLQSIIFVPIFYGFGLGLATQINLAISIALGIVIFCLQVVISKWWLSHFIYGPFEWLWRSLTWLKLQPMVRVKS